MQDYKLCTMSEVESAGVRFLTKPYIPAGRISLILGNPGEGKTTLSPAIAAAVTSGAALPWSDAPCEIGDIVFQPAEDCYADTIKPRLELLGADCSRVHFVDDTDCPLSLADERLERAITETNAKLLVADPIQGFLGKADINNANAMRGMMKSLGAVAEKTGCAVCLIGHLNKASVKSVYRGLGSIDIYAAARSVMMVGRLPYDDDRRAFVHAKSNLIAPGRAQAFGFDPVSGFTWLEDADITADQLLDHKPNIVREEKTDTQKDAAMTFLQTELAGGAVPSTRLMRDANAQGITEITLRRAKKAIGVRSYQEGREWFCALDAPGSDAHLHSVALSADVSA
jgi:hypothetical protein